MTAPLRVLYVLPEGERGGVERFLESVFAHHDAAAVRPVVLAAADGAWTTELRRAGLAVHVLEGPRLSKPWHHFPVVRSLLARERIDVVHSTYAWAHALVRPATLAAGVPSFWFHHGPVAPGRWQGLAPLMPSPLLLANSHFLANQLRRTIHGAGRVEVVHYGLATAEFTANGDRRARMRAQWGLAPHELAIGIVGFIDTWKGQDVFLRAAARLAPRRPDMRFFVVGGPRQGAARARCEALWQTLHRFSREAGLESAVTFTGHVDMSGGALDALDVVVHASTEPEPFGMVLLEAMAAGKTVIASAEGGPTEIVRSGVDGLLIAPGDDYLLAATLERVADEPSLRARLGSAAVARVASDFHPRRPARQLEALYRQLASHRRRRDA